MVLSSKHLFTPNSLAGNKTKLNKNPCHLPVPCYRRRQPGPAGLPAQPEPPAAAQHRPGVLPDQAHPADPQVPAAAATAEAAEPGGVGRAAAPGGGAHRHGEGGGAHQRDAEDPRGVRGHLRPPVQAAPEGGQAGNCGKADRKAKGYFIMENARTKSGKGVKIVL